jgi:monoamine oxidase
VGDDWSVLPGMARVEAIKGKLQAMANALDPAAPWQHPQARTWMASRSRSGSRRM